MEFTYSSPNIYIYIWDLLGHTSVIVLDNSLGLYIKNIMDYNGKQ